MLRRLAFVRSAQRVGLTLDEIRDLLAVLPTERAPTKAQWGSLSRAMRRRLDARMAELEQLRETLTSCIGCGCLSLRVVPALEPRRDGGAGCYGRPMIEVTCMCGFQARGTEDEVVAQIQAHGRADHGSMSSREQILAMAVPADAGDAG